MGGWLGDVQVLFGLHTENLVQVAQAVTGNFDGQHITGLDDLAGDGYKMALVGFVQFEDDDVIILTQASFFQGLAQQWRVGQGDYFGDVGLAAHRVADGFGGAAFRHDVAADKEHVTQPEQEDGQADFGEFKHAQRFQFVLGDQSADDDIG